MKLYYFFGLLILPALTLAAKVCQNEVCKKFSADLLHNSMNTSVDPCDDFYEYICGNYPTHHALDPEMHEANNVITRHRLIDLEVDEALLKAANSSSKIVRYISEMYSECVDDATREKRGVTPLIDLAEDVFGGWPMIRKPKTGMKPKWTDLFASVYSKLGLRYILTIDSSSHELYIGVGPISLNPEHHSQPSTKVSNETIVKRYRQFLHQMVDIMGTHLNREKVTEDIEKLIHFEQQIEKIFSMPDSHGPDNLEGTLSEFKVATENHLDLMVVMNQILKNFNSTKAPYTPASKVAARQLQSLKLILDLLDTTPIEVIQNFYGTLVALHYGQITTKKLNEAIFAFTKRADFPASCAELLSNWPMALGRIYVDTHFSAHEKKDATMLVSEIRASFRANLQTNTWLGVTTKKFAIEKLDAMGQEVGYPDWILNDTRLDALYPEERQVKGKFLENIATIKAGFLKAELEYIPEPKNKSHNENISPVEVNAFYSPSANSIFMPAGICQPPFFDHEMPWSINYGAIGAIIGHEMTHGFDSDGSEYDKNGARKNWWSNESLVKFHNLTGCIRDQYSAIHDPTTDQNLSGEHTLAENIADNGGLKEAFSAYKSHLAKMNDAMTLPGLDFTSDQLFFVSHANSLCEANTVEGLKQQIQMDPHSPNRYRVNVVLGNTPQFAAAFKCPLGSRMNPIKKCSVW